MVKREVFMASVAQRITIHSADDLTTQDWFKDHYSQIANAVADRGYNMEDMADMDFSDENHANLYFLIGQHVTIADKEFRGYTLGKGDLIMIDDKMSKALCDADTYGDKDFSDYDVFEISGICHNERDNCVEYFIKCFAEGVEPMVVEL